MASGGPQSNSNEVDDDIDSAIRQLGLQGMPGTDSLVSVQQLDCDHSSAGNALGTDGQVTLLSEQTPSSPLRHLVMSRSGSTTNLARTSSPLSVGRNSSDVSVGRTGTRQLPRTLSRTTSPLSVVTQHSDMNAGTKRHSERLVVRQVSLLLVAAASLVIFSVAHESWSAVIVRLHRCDMSMCVDRWHVTVS